MTGAEQRIYEWMQEQARPVLYSELREELGIRTFDPAHESLRKQGLIEAVYPERIEGKCSGRQFWQVKAP
jgi:hypothetical protein